TITADKSTVTSGSAEKITVTIKADGLSNMAYIMPDVRLQRYADTSWVRVKPNTTLNPVIIGKAQLGKISETEYSRSAKLVFTPDLYADNIAPGHYRLAIPVSAGTKTITLYHEFDITKNGFSTADKQAYDIRSTQKISFETYLNKDENVYPRVNELYFREDGKWVLVSPKKGREFASGTVSAKGGSTYTSVLDLTRYDKTELKTGRYMVYVGDGIRSEFRLTNPVDVEAYQIPAQNKGNIKVRLILHCRKYDSVDITKYGELYYYSNGKWEKMESKKTYLPGDLHLEKGMVYMQDYLITDFYKARGMKSGRYAIRLYTSTGEYADVYFDLEIEEQ
ncbi:MAG: hypothetical protein IKR73_00810, partial [Oscillospiraceae bacterium]|nr:hypothetical protein [Oscillospiraceae bacterium]